MPEEYKVDYKKIFTRSRDEIARDELLFAQAKAKLEEFVPKTDAQHAYQMGLSRQKAIYPAYRNIRSKTDAELSNADLQNFIILTNQLAESAALQGKFFRAARLHQSYLQSGEYLLMGNAVKMRRFTHPCPKTQIVSDGISAKGRHVSTRHAVLEVYLGAEKKELVIFKCLECKKYFAEYKD